MTRGKICSLNKFLASNPSSGPKEAPYPGSEFTSYASADLDVKLLLVLAKKNDSISKVVCIPDYFVSFDSFGENVTFSSTRMHEKSIRSGMLVTRLHTSRPNVYMPDDIHDLLKKCERRGKRFVVFNLGLYWDNGYGHANSLIFDLKERIVERYEPAGKKGILPKHELSRAVASKFPTWTFIGPDKMKTGAQGLADSFTGMCVTFSLHYTLLRLSNPDESAIDVYKHILQRHKEGKLKEDILRLNKFAIDELKKMKRGSLDSVRAIHYDERRKFRIVRPLLMDEREAMSSCVARKAEKRPCSSSRGARSRLAGRPRSRRRGDSCRT